MAKSGVASVIALVALTLVHTGFTQNSPSPSSGTENSYSQSSSSQSSASTQSATSSQSSTQTHGSSQQAENHKASESSESSHHSPKAHHMSHHKHVSEPLLDEDPFAPQDPFALQDVLAPPNPALEQEIAQQVLVKQIKECLNLKLNGINNHCPADVKDKAWCGSECQTSVNTTLNKLEGGACCNIARDTPFEGLIPMCKNKLMPKIVVNLRNDYTGQCSVSSAATDLSEDAPMVGAPVVGCMGFFAGAIFTATVLRMRRKISMIDEQPLLV